MPYCIPGHRHSEERSLQGPTWGGAKTETGHRPAQHADPRDPPGLTGQTGSGGLRVLYRDEVTTYSRTSKSWGQNHTWPRTDPGVTPKHTGQATLSSYPRVYKCMRRYCDK